MRIDHPMAGELYDPFGTDTEDLFDDGQVEDPDLAWEPWEGASLQERTLRCHLAQNIWLRARLRAVCGDPRSWDAVVFDLDDEFRELAEKARVRLRSGDFK